jgi:hypothetical protein
MKTSVIAATAIALLLVGGVATVALANHGVISLANPLGASNSQGQQNQGDDHGNETATQHQDNETGDQGENESGGLNFTVGQTFTLANLTGHFNNLTNQSSEDTHDDSRAGNASGTFTFKVTAVSSHEVNVTITSGSFTINSTAFTVTGGNLTLNSEDRSGSGTGTASGGTTFTIRVDGIHGNTTSGLQVGAIKLDVHTGTSDYQVILGTPESGDSSSED